MDYIISLAGLALMVAPWAAGYTGNATAMWTSIVLGAVVLLVAGYRAVADDQQRWEEWTAGAAGIVAIAAPFVLGFPQPATWASAVLGLVVAGLAAYQVFYALPGAAKR